MMRTVFALTRTPYDSYTDYLVLARRAWKDCCFINEIKMSEPIIYIVSPMNGEFRPHIDNHRNEAKKCKILWWNLERPPRDENHERHKRDVKELLNRYVDYMVVSDKWFKNTYYKEFGDKIQYCPMGIDKALCEDPWKEGHSQHSFAHMSYVWGRRGILNSLPNTLGNCWGDERKRGLLRTKFMVNVHQDQYGVIEPLRFALAVSHGLPIITEWSHNLFPYGDAVIATDYGQIVSVANKCANDNYAKYAEMARRAYDKMLNQYGFVKCVKEMCDKLPM
ncbi:MAG: hypothetical protein Q8K86_07140 [Candidatus Nanopelagicaceae bacterium]|nr:hypothetical protein [Candidatus Nanopelagicaceae bacterium]